MKIFPKINHDSSGFSVLVTFQSTCKCFTGKLTPPDPHRIYPGDNVGESHPQSLDTKIGMYRSDYRGAGFGNPRRGCNALPPEGARMSCPDRSK